jgi:hypothetical protein
MKDHRQPSVSDEIDLVASAAEAIARAIHDSRPEGPDDSLLVGFVVVCEWVNSDGVKWLSKISADGTGDPTRITFWQEHGYLNEVLNNWPNDYEEEEEEDEE